MSEDNRGLYFEALNSSNYGSLQDKQHSVRLLLYFMLYLFNNWIDDHGDSLLLYCYLYYRPRVSASYVRYRKVNKSISVD